MLPATTPDTRDRVAGSASAAGTYACGDAVEGAIAALGQKPGLVLIFPAGDIAPDDAALQAHAAASGASVAGMTGSGAIGEGRVIDTGCSAIAFSSSLPTGVGAVEAGDPRTAGREAAAQALAATDAAPYRIVLLFVDSESGDQAEVVAGAYAVAGGRIPLAGGAAGGVARARFADGRSFPGGVVAVAIGSSTPIGVGIAHGCVARGGPSIVTRSNGGTVLRLDGRPAQDVYFEKLGLRGADLDDNEFEVLAMAHPLAEPQLSGGPARPRYLRARAPDGGLVCATSIERNAAVEICEQTPDTIVRSARRAVEDAVSQLGGPAEAALVFDCAGRSAWFRGDLAQRELDALVAAFGDPAPALAGAYTRGEIGRTRGAKGDRNHSVVVVAFTAPD
jgi:hypothetical protein